MLLGLIAGSTASGAWRTYLQWRNGASFGVKDPQFGKDISFFTFDLPWYRFVLGFAFATVVVAPDRRGGHALPVRRAAAAAAARRARHARRAGAPVGAARHVRAAQGGRLLARPLRAGGQGAPHRRADFTGLAYTDVNAVLPGKTILAIISLICAALFFANIVRRTWLLPGIGVGLLLLSALLIGGIYPAIVQRFQVTPSEADKERPTSSATSRRPGRPTASTRQGRDLQPYDAKTTADQASCAPTRTRPRDIRLLDPAIAEPDVQEPAADQALLRLPRRRSTSTATRSTARRGTSWSRCAR